MERVFAERDAELRARGLAALHVRSQPRDEHAAALRLTSTKAPHQTSKRRRWLLVVAAFLVGLVLGPLVAAMAGLEVRAGWHEDAPIRIEIERNGTVTW